MAAFVDGRLPPEARADVMAHIADCPDCYALVSAGWDYEAIEEEEELPPVVEGPFGSWWKWAVAAVAASLIIVVALPTISFQRDRSALIAAQSTAKNRPVEGRLSMFSYQPAVRPKRGLPEDEELSKYQIQFKAAELTQRTARTARQWQAQSAAHLLLDEKEKAIDAIERAAAAKPDDPSILSDRIVAYLAAGDTRHALEAAERAWQVAQTPEIAFNRALAIEAGRPRNEAIAAWQESLKLDPNSPWAADAREHLQRLQDLL